MLIVQHLRCLQISWIELLGEPDDEGGTEVAGHIDITLGMSNASALPCKRFYDSCATG